MKLTHDHTISERARTVRRYQNIKAGPGVIGGNLSGLAFVSRGLAGIIESWDIEVTTPPLVTGYSARFPVDRWVLSGEITRSGSCGATVAGAPGAKIVWTGNVEPEQTIDRTLSVAWSASWSGHGAGLNTLTYSTIGDTVISVALGSSTNQGGSCEAFEYSDTLIYLRLPAGSQPRFTWSNSTAQWWETASVRISVLSQGLWTFGGNSYNP